MNRKSNILSMPETPRIKIPLARKITPELVPHSEFHTGRWLHSAKKKGWYYFMREENFNSIANRYFIKSLDWQLRELVSFLHAKNIKTTPSCAGHYIPKRLLEYIYIGLEAERDQILDNGLRMKDVESGEKILFRDKNYSLPWNKKDFIEQLFIYQRKGVLGLRLNNLNPEKEQILNLNIKDVQTTERDNITFIFTYADHPGNNYSAWKEITRRVKAILD